MRIGLVSNARSERNKRGLADIERLVRTAPEVVHLHFDGSRSVIELMRELARHEVGLVVINGGDGTVQGILTALFEDRPFAEPPPLAILPRGMANMTARDVGLTGRGAAALERLLGAVRGGVPAGRAVTRHVLRIENLADAPPQRGMFFGAGGIYDAITICKSRVHALGFKGEASHAVTLAALLAIAAVRGLDSVGLHGHDIAVALDDAPSIGARRLLVLATTLERLVLRSQPFWNTEHGPVRFTSIGYPPERLTRHARKLLYGGPVRDLPEPGYLSRGATRVALDLDGPFTIDGQFFAPVPGRPLVLTAAETARFVRL
ncbi:MAG TPA: diacylglycerol kinase family protein [Geminicoccaceae bacterium]|nr:diacylglycerol kinase family protein [Geminicoccaceae bacterium]